MKELQSGANITLDNQNAETISVSWAPEKIQGCDVDASAFLLKANGKVRSDHNFIFYNFPNTKDGAVSFVESDNSSKFILQLSKIPSEIEKVAFAVTIHGTASFPQASALNIQVGQSANFATIIARVSPRRTRCVLASTVALFPDLYSNTTKGSCAIAGAADTRRNAKRSFIDRIKTFLR